MSEGDTLTSLLLAASAFSRLGTVPQHRYNSCFLVFTFVPRPESQ